MADDSPAAVLVDSVNGVELAVPDGAAIPANTRRLLVAGQEGVNARTLLVDPSGRPIVTSDPSAPVRVDPTGTTTQPISAASLPLPTGAATETTLSAQLNITISALRDALAGASPSTNTIYDLEQTLEALLTKLTEVDSVLDAIKAPANTQAATRLRNNADTAYINSILVNAIERLEARSKLTGQVAGAGPEVDATIIEDTENSAEKRIQTEARLAPGSLVNIGTGVPANPSDLVISFCVNGSSENMLVDGSSTVVNFDFVADPTDDLAINSLLLVFSADDFEFDGSSFGPNSVLSNGIDLQTIIGGVTTTVFCIKQNEDFLRVPGRTPIVNNTGPKDIMAIDLSFGGLVKLTAGSADKVRVQIQDNLTSVKLKYLTGTVYAVKET